MQNLQKNSHFGATVSLFYIGSATFFCEYFMKFCKDKKIAFRRVPSTPLPCKHWKRAGCSAAGGDFKKLKV
jgi:hypothetical protein